VTGTWQERLKAQVPREKIPQYLSQLQALVARLREWRDAQRVPEPGDIAPLLTPLLREHADLTVGYVTDPRYAEVVEAALSH
jgi:hypothetical protein